MADTLVVKVKQGEELALDFTINQGGAPMDLSEYQIAFQVRKAPLEKLTPIIDKLITTTSDFYTVGQIVYPQNGRFTVHLGEEDTKFPVGEYYLVVALAREGEFNIISSPCCSSGKYIICEQ